MSISLTCECGRCFETLEADVGQRAHCPWCGRELIVPKPSVLLEDDWLPFKPELTTTSGKAIASLVLGGLFVLACLSGVPAILLGRSALRDIRQSGGRLVGKRMAVTGIVLGVIGCLFTAVVLSAAFGEDIEWSRQTVCTNNLKQIGMALHAYHDAYGSFPAAALADKNGKPVLSWRVAILPYLEGQRPLYDKFHIGEPWNSPHNFALLDSMPRVFDCPSDRTKKPRMTGYEAVIGPETAFTPDFKPLSFRDFTGGNNYKLLIGESRRSVPWTKPDDLAFDLSVPLSGLGSFHERPTRGFHCLFADGWVRFIKATITPDRLRALLTPNGNVNDDWQSY